MKKSVEKAANFISSLEIWVVSIVVLLSMVKTELLPWAVLVAILFWPVRWIANGRPSLRTPADFADSTADFADPRNAMGHRPARENDSPSLSTGFRDFVFLCSCQLG